MFVPHVSSSAYINFGFNAQNAKAIVCLFLQGRHCEEQDDFAQAEKCYLEYLKDHPNDPKTLSHLAYVRSRLPPKQYTETFPDRYRYEYLFWTEGFEVEDKIKMSQDPELQDLNFWIVLCQYLQTNIFPSRHLAKLFEMPLPEAHYVAYIVSIFSVVKDRKEIVEKFMKSLIHRTEVKIAKHLVWYFIKWGDFKNAAIAVSHLPIDDDGFHIFLRAKVLEMQGKVKEAKALFLTMKNICEPLKYAERLKALEYFNDPSYQSEVLIAYAKFPNDPDIATARALLEKDRFLKIARLKQISEKNPWHYNSKLKWLETLEKYDVYLATISKQIAELPLAYNLRVKRVQIALKTKSFLKEAEEDCKFLMEAGKSHIQKDYLEVLTLKNDFHSMVKVASRILFLEPLNPRAFYIKALAHFRLGETQSSWLMLDVLESIGPLNLSAKRLKGELLFAEKRYAEAADSLQDLKPNDKEIAILKIFLVSQLEMGKKAEAKAFFAKIDPSIRVFMAEISQQLNPSP